MAQSGSYPNPDLSNAIVHRPLRVCSDLNTQRRREDNGGDEEDEDVELAEEVGEDVSVMAEAGEGQAKGESRERRERDDVRIIQVALLPNGVVREREGESGILEESGEGGVEVGDEEHEMINEQTRENKAAGKGEEESIDTKTVIEKPCYFSALIEGEKGQEHILNRNKENKEDRADEENKPETMIACSDTEVWEDKTNDGDNWFEEHQVVSRTDDAEHVQDLDALVKESGEDTQLSTDDTDKTEVDTLPVDAEVTESIDEPTIDVTPVTKGINEQVNNHHDTCQTSTISKNGIPFDTIGTNKVVANQTKQLTCENKDEIKNTDEKDNSESSKQEVESINNNSMWQQEDCIVAKVEDEGTKEFLKDVTSDSGDVLDIRGEANQKVEQPGLAVEWSKTERGIEETRMIRINQKEPEQVRHVWVHTLRVMEGGGQSTEEEGKTGDNIVRESMGVEEHRGNGDLEMHEEKIVHVENQAKIDLPEPVLQCVEEVPLYTQQNVDLDQVEEAFELEEGDEVEPDKPGGEVTLAENNSTKEEGDDLQEHPLQFLKEENDREKLREQALIEDEKGGGAEEEAMEMAEEPVTVLDDVIEEREERPSGELQEQKPATITASSEDTIVETKDGEYQELQGEKVDLGKENDKKEKSEKGVVQLDINGRVKGLKQAMENGILSPEPQPLRKEEWGTARVLSPKRKDNDWIKKGEPGEERAPEGKDWRKELRPVKKDIWESERGRKEWVKNETSPKKDKGPQRKDDWIKELKSVIKDESLPKKRDAQVKKKRVVLLDGGHSYVPQREEMTEENREEVKLISHRRVDSPLPPLHRNNRTPQDQDYKISLYVKVMNHKHLHILYVHTKSIALHILHNSSIIPWSR